MSRAGNALKINDIYIRIGKMQSDERRIFLQKL